MRRYLKTVSLVLILILLALGACGCGYRGYKKQHAGAYVLAYTQVPDILGARDAIGLRDPEILLLDSDSYGRRLYLYYEDSDGFLSVLVVQKETDERVYFYPEESTVSFRLPDSVYDLYNPKKSDEELKTLLSELCGEDELFSFKQLNDWGLPMNESKLESAEIVLPKLDYRWSHRQDKINLVSDVWLKNALAVAEKNGHPITEDIMEASYFNHVSWMATDSYGRRLYYVECCYYIYGDENDPNLNYRMYCLEMVAIINPDRTFDANTFMAELVDKADYNEIIRELKTVNGWNQPFGEEAEQ
jgi:hypothetical protein